MQPYHFSKHLMQITPKPHLYSSKKADINEVLLLSEIKIQQALSFRE